MERKPGLAEQESAVAADTQTKVGPGHAIIRGPLAALLLIRLFLSGRVLNLFRILFFRIRARIPARGQDVAHIDRQIGQQLCSADNSSPLW